MFTVKVFKAIKHIHLSFAVYISNSFCHILFFFNNIEVSSFKCRGYPYVHISLKAKLIIGDKFIMNNGSRYSDSGLNGKCRIEVRDIAILIIGNNVGMSDVTITCHESISIGNNVLLGVGTQIRDTDNHSLNHHDRMNGLDWKNKKTAPVIIKDNVFIGTCSIVLKGVTIGENSVIGAGSVVTKNIPNDEIWAGNPARFIRTIKH